MESTPELSISAHASGGMCAGMSRQCRGWNQSKKEAKGRKGVADRTLCEDGTSIELDGVSSRELITWA